MVVERLNGNGLHHGHFHVYEKYKNLNNGHM